MKMTKKTKMMVPLTTLALFAAACSGGNGSSNGGTSNEGGSGDTNAAVDYSLQCDYEPTGDDLLGYELPTANAEYDITLMQVSTAGYYYQGIDAGADEAAAAAGVNLTKLAAGDYSSPEDQLRLVEDSLQRGTDAVILAPSDIQGSVPVVEIAKEHGVPVINISSEVDSDDAIKVIQDDYTFGKMAADRIAEVLGDEGGKGIIIAGPANATWSLYRTAGFTDRVEEMYPNIEIVDAPTQAVDPAEGLRSFEDSVQANPDIDWIFAVHYYILLPESIPANYKGQIPYVAGGLEPDSIDALESGNMDSVFGLTPLWAGRLGVGYAIAALNGEELPSITCTPIILYTPDDVDSDIAKEELIP